MKENWNGFVGNILRIDLTSKKIVKSALDRKTAQMFLGGIGYSAKILWDELKPGIDPLGPENKLIISTGPLTGTLCPGSDSWIACFKSPLTNCWGETRSGGGLGPELKRAGFDLVILEGISESPVYVWIHDGEAEIKAAVHLWGNPIPETERLLRREEGGIEAKIVSIGPAGEKLVRFASLMSEGRAAARCGAGAVLGSKMVKAIIVRGHGGISVADPEAFISVVGKVEEGQSRLPICGTREGAFGAGTMSWLPFYNKRGVILTKNGASNCWEGKGEEFYKQLKEKYVIGSRACESCTMGCGQYSKVKEGKWITPTTKGPEYETIAAFGHYILNDNVEALIHASYLCDIYGIDTISCGATIAFAMECYENGWISKKDTDGIELNWGNMDAVKALIEKIAHRDGFGKLLGEGAKRAAEKIGGEAPEIAVHVKGLEIPAHDPRGSYAGKSWAVQYGTASRGGCHIHPQEPSVLIGYYGRLGFKESDWPGITEPLKPEGKGKIVKWTQDYGNAVECMGICKFHSFTSPAITPAEYAAMISAATGWNISSEELFKIGERVSNLQRCFNAREDIRRKDDYLPKRLCQVPAFGPYSRVPETAITREDLDAMLDEYYEARGWEKETGIPSSQKLQWLGLSEEAKQLSKYLS